MQPGKRLPQRGTTAAEDDQDDEEDEPAGARHAALPLHVVVKVICIRQPVGLGKCPLPEPVLLDVVYHGVPDIVHACTRYIDTMGIAITHVSCSTCSMYVYFVLRPPTSVNCIWTRLTLP